MGGRAAGNGTGLARQKTCAQKSQMGMGFQYAFGGIQQLGIPLIRLNHGPNGYGTQFPTDGRRPGVSDFGGWTRASFSAEAHSAEIWLRPGIRAYKNFCPPPASSPRGTSPELTRVLSIAPGTVQLKMEWPARPRGLVGKRTPAAGRRGLLSSPAKLYGVSKRHRRTSKRWEGHTNGGHRGRRVGPRPCLRIPESRQCLCCRTKSVWARLGRRALGILMGKKTRGGANAGTQHHGGRDG